MRKSQIKTNLELHPYLTLDENGLVTLKPVPEPKSCQMEITVPVVKFHAMTRECPIHGVQRVVTRNFQPALMNSIEGLACGHTVLITRDVKGLRKDTHYTLTEPQAWRFWSWRLTFKESILAS